MSTPGDLLAHEAASLVARLRVWTPARWGADAGSHGTRADLVHHLAQWLADEAGESPVRLPRLENDLALPDQLAVTADDLVRRGTVDHRATAHLLAHRRDLLGDEIPSGLLRKLNGAPVSCPAPPEPGGT